MNSSLKTSILRPLRWAGVLVLLFALSSSVWAQKTPRVTQHKLRILHTTDVHGNIFPYDFLNDRPGSGSMSRLSTVLREVRRTDPETLLLDAGDLLHIVSCPQTITITEGGEPALGTHPCPREDDQMWTLGALSIHRRETSESS